MIIIDFYEDGVLSRTWKFTHEFEECRRILLSECREYGTDKLLDPELQTVTIERLRVAFNNWIEALNKFVD